MITGGAGLIGTHLAELLYRNNNIYILDTSKQINRNINNFKHIKVKKFYKGTIENYNLCQRATSKKDIVIHLAAMLGVKNTENNNYKCFSVNVEGTKNIFNSSIKSKVKRFIFASSSEVYGEPKKNPIKENFPLIGKSIYAISKILGEKIVMVKQHKIKTTIFRFFNTIGKGQVAQFVVTRFIKAIKENKPVLVNGNGSQVRSYSNAKDIALGISKSLDNKKTFSNIYNLGNSKEPISLKILLKKILLISKKKNYKKIIFKKNFIMSDRKKKREIFRRFCSTKKANTDFNFKLQTKLDVSLLEIINQKKIFSSWPDY